jgi:FkbM family methyltransferase
MSDARLEISHGLQRDGRGTVGVLVRKLSTARRVYRDDGARGMLVVLKGKATPIIECFSIRRLRTACRSWRQQEHWWVGLMVVLRGNVVSVDGCTFGVSHPAIATATKSLLLLGGYERAERDILKEYLNRTRPVIELGGSIGVVACVTNTLLTDRRKHVVVEANPDLIGLLIENRDRNGCLFTVLNRALAYGGDETIFYRDAVGFLGSSVQVKTTRPIQVPTISLRRIVEDYGFDTCTLVCDIEGGEMDLVRHERQVLRDRVETIIVEVHGWRVGHDRAEEMIRTLEGVGFRCLHEREGTYVFRNESLARLRVAEYA